MQRKIAEIALEEQKKQFELAIKEQRKEARKDRLRIAVHDAVAAADDAAVEYDKGLEANDAILQRMRSGVFRWALKSPTAMRSKKPCAGHTISPTWPLPPQGVLLLMGHVIRLSSNDCSLPPKRLFRCFLPYRAKTTRK